MANLLNHPTALLLVEGNDDFHVIHSLCKQFNINVRNLENPKGGEFSIKDCKGIDKLIEQIPILFKSSNKLKNLGIIIDADNDLQARWDTIKNLLQKIGFPIPNILPRDGLILNTASVNIGVWVMPNNNLNGMLEDFVSFLIPPNDKLLPLIEATLIDIEGNGFNNYPLIHKSKALIYSWLAVQKVPGTTLGQSITKKYLTTDEANCHLLVDWIKNLFL